MSNNGKCVIIHVNGRRIGVESQRVSYEKVLELSDLKTPDEHEFVMFLNAVSEPSRGLLTKGRDVIVSRSVPTQFQVV